MGCLFLYGICDASGNGSIDEGQANEWVKTMDEHGISYVAWNLSNKSETSAMISSSCSKISGFGKDDLSASGKWVYEMLTGKSVNDFQPSNTGNTGSGSSGSQTTGQTGSGSSDNQQSVSQPSATNPPTANVSTGAGLDIQAEVKDSWETQDGKNYNYSLNITNHSGKAITGWNITLKFSGTLTSVQGWGGSYTIDGNTLRISNESYNGALADGASINDVGFIIAGSTDLHIVEE